MAGVKHNYLVEKMSNSMEMSASITIKIPRLKVRKFLVTQPVHLKWFFNLLESKLHLEAGITSGLLNILLFMFLSFATPCWVAALGFALGSCFAIKVHFHRIFFLHQEFILIRQVFLLRFFMNIFSGGITMI